MENTLLVSLSHQGILRRQMDVIAHNVANMNSAGFKAQKLLVEDHTVRSAGGETVFGDRVSFVRDVMTIHDMTEGALESTGNAFDLAVRGDGWFVVETEAGERYTRNGRFRMDTDGRLVTADGHAVQGEGGAPIALDAGDADFVVARDGTVTGGAGEIGRLRIVRFADAQALESVGSGLMAADVAPEAVVDPHVVQGMIEGSNVEPITEITRMISVQRAYQGASKLIEREDERIRKMVEAYTK